MSLAGWTIIEDSEDGSLLVQAPNGQRRRVWQESQEMLDLIQEALDGNCGYLGTDWIERARKLCPSK